MISEYKTEKKMEKFLNKYCGSTAKDEWDYYQNILGLNLIPVYFT